jgi:hypothetical protein
MPLLPHALTCPQHYYMAIKFQCEFVKIFSNSRHVLALELEPNKGGNREIMRLEKLSFAIPRS